MKLQSNVSAIHQLSAETINYAVMVAAGRGEKLRRARDSQQDAKRSVLEMKLRQLNWMLIKSRLMIRALEWRLMMMMTLQFCINFSNSHKLWVRPVPSGGVALYLN